MEGGQEKFVGNVCHPWLVHQQDRTALVAELPLTLEDDGLNIRDFSVSPIMIFGAGQKSQRIKAYAPAPAFTSNCRTSNELI